MEVFDTSRMHITYRNIEETPSIREYVEKKSSFLDRFAKYIERVDITIANNASESLKFQYEVTISLVGGTVRIEERGNDLYGLIDLAHDRLKTKIEKFKERIVSHAYPLEVDHDDEIASDASDIQDYTLTISKHKVYSDNKPLHPQEAILQMEMIGHQSFLFKNSETGTYAMIYKRHNGTYGLIEPEIP